MGTGGWITTNWLDLVQTVAILGGYLLTRRSSKEEARQRRVTNRNEMTKNHREISMLRFSHPELGRVEDRVVDLKLKPITTLEKWFVHLHVLHLANNYRTAKDGMFSLPEEITMDIANFFSRPIPRAVWEMMRPFHDKDFVRFIDEHRDA